MAVSLDCPFLVAFLAFTNVYLEGNCYNMCNSNNLSYYYLPFIAVTGAPV